MTVKTKLKGSYCLLINLKQDSKITVGKLGKVDFKKGYYIYVGSALNSLEGRIKRHLKDDKKIFWHIDYFLAHKNAEILDVVFTVSDAKWECKIAEGIADKGVGIKNFGCSDCKCHSHLFFFEEFIDSKNSCLNAFEELNLNSRYFKE